MFMDDNEAMAALARVTVNEGLNDDYVEGLLDGIAIAISHPNWSQQLLDAAVRWSGDDPYADGRFERFVEAIQLP